jgi:hypothetical protein
MPQFIRLMPQFMRQFMRLMPLLLVLTSLIVRAHAQSHAQAQIQSPAELPKTAMLRYKGIVDIVRLNDMNSSFVESNPYITPDGKFLFFQSERGGQPWSRKKDRVSERTGQETFDGDIWYAERVGTGATSTWKAAEPMDASVNTMRGEDEPFITFDGRTVLFQSWRDGWRDNGGPYYEAKFEGALWGKPTGLGSGIHDFFYNMRYIDTAFATDGSAFSTDQSVFVVTAGKRYDEDMDLYISRKDTKGQWTYPKKIILPDAVGASSDERSVFLAADNKTLYFSSNGLGGLGGLDIYKATLNNDNTLSNVVNIGEPFNTKGDDYGFSLTAAGDEAFFVRNGDLYSARLGAAMNALKPQSVAIAKGVVKNKETGVPMEATVEFRELPKGNVVRCMSNTLTGEYGAVLRVGGNYEQVVMSPNFGTFSRKFKAVTTKQGNIMLEFDVLLAPPRKTW